MLPRKHSFSLRKKPKDFYKAGRTYHSPLLSLQVVDGEEGQKVSQCAFIISKKLDKRAVGRHRMTRLLADVMVDYINSIPIKTLVVVGKQPLVTASKEEVTTALTTLLKEAGLI